MISGPETMILGRETMVLGRETTNLFSAKEVLKKTSTFLCNAKVTFFPLKNKFYVHKFTSRPTKTVGAATTFNVFFEHLY